MNSKNHLPIGVFDSGVGGLTVLNALQQKLPNESFLYLGDTARLPYGIKSPETVIRYAQQAVALLVDKGIKSLVVACNTASTLALDALAKQYPELPMIGVVKPGAKFSAQHTSTGNIAVIATEATVKNGAYEREIKKYLPQANVISKSCDVFVSLAEEGWTNNAVSKVATKEYLQLLFLPNQHDIDCLVLGCTHFPVFKKVIADLIGKDVYIVDSAIAIAHEVNLQLNENDIPNGSAEIKPTTFLVTDAPERFSRVAMNFLHEEINLSQIELVDIYSI